MNESTHLARFDPLAGNRAARFFDADYAGYTDDLPILKAYAKRTGGPILELGCGTGRLVIPLASAGYTVTGIDHSPGMLAVARARVAERGGKTAGRLTLIEGDFVSAELNGPYRLAYVVMNTFLHLLTLEDQLRALQHWRAHLAPDGLLLIDIFFPDIEEMAGLNGQIELDKRWTDHDGSTVMKQVVRTVDPAGQILHVTFIYDVVQADGRVERTLVPFDLRYMWPFEAELLLDKAGFVLEGIYGSWDLEPLDSGSERMILVARRPAA